MTITLSPQEKDHLSTAPFCAPELFGLDFSQVMNKYQERLTLVAFKKISLFSK